MVVCQEGVPVACDPRFVELPLLAFVSSSFSLGLMFCLPQRSLYRCWLLCITKRGTLFGIRRSICATIFLVQLTQKRFAVVHALLPFRNSYIFYQMFFEVGLVN